MSCQAEGKNSPQDLAQGALVTLIKVVLEEIK